LLRRAIAQRLSHGVRQSLMILSVPDSGHLDRHSVSEGDGREDGSLDDETRVIARVSDDQCISGRFQVRPAGIATTQPLIAISHRAPRASGDH
jgi:hypothetical protein